MHIEWLSTLALQSKIPPNAAVFDLGPQDLWTEREPLRRVARRHLLPDACETALQEIFGDEAKPRTRSARSIRSSEATVIGRST
jgi:hypothetical protein